VCSNRGICDVQAGLCYCFDQFSGANCDEYKNFTAAAIVRDVDYNQVLTVESSNPDFDKTVLTLNTFDIGTDAFTTMKAVNLDRTVFEMTGYGDVTMHYGSLTIGGANFSVTGGAIAGGGQTIGAGGLSVVGGMTTYSGKLSIGNRVLVYGGGVTVNNGGVTIVGSSTFNGDATMAGAFTVYNKLNVGLVRNIC
jgi:hypothetical protein